MEIWKDIPNYEGYYMVSNLGRVKALSRIYPHSVHGAPSLKREALLTACPNNKGYLRVFLSKNNKVKSCYIHRLVADLFVFHPSGKFEINHIDGNKNNNCEFNLEWCTKSENIEHALANGLMKWGESVKFGKFKFSDIDNILSLPHNGYTRREISKIYGVNKNSIRCILIGKTWNRYTGIKEMPK